LRALGITGGSLGHPLFATGIAFLIHSGPVPGGLYP
jgi:hypothetical protein